MVALMILIPVLSYADVRFDESYDEFTDDKLIMTVGNMVENEENELISMEYTGAVSKEGVVLDFALIITYIGDDWIHIKNVRLRGDSEEAKNLVCEYKNHKVRDDGLLMEQCIVGIDIDILKNLSNAEIIKVGLGGVVGTTNPEVLRDFLKKFEK
jgi:hypothetical protein